MSHQTFAKNFEENLIVGFAEENLQESKRFLTHYLERDSLQGLTFLDAGCGSGVFTLAALGLGAKVTSFDYDPLALQNTKTLMLRFGYAEDSVTLLQGSVLDKSFLQQLGTFDVVLCWGVAHHCGNMWRCLELIPKTVKPGGLLHLGIYNHADGWGFYPDGRFGPSSFWKKIKKFYVGLPGFAQTMFDYGCIAGISLIYLLTLNNPLKKLRSNERRGMTWRSDLKDWLIGYPYEYATPEQVFEFMKQQEFTLTKLRTNNGLLTNNFVFKRKL